MSKRFARTLLSAACMLLPVAAVAADLIPVETFARHVPLSDAALSPDGEHIARAHGRRRRRLARAGRLQGVRHDPSRSACCGCPSTRSPVSIDCGQQLLADRGEKGKRIRLDRQAVAAPAKSSRPTSTASTRTTSTATRARYGTRAGTRGGDRGWGFVDGMPEPDQRPLLHGRAELGQRQPQHAVRRRCRAQRAPPDRRHRRGRHELHGRQAMARRHFAYGRNDDYDYVVYHRQGAAGHSCTPQPDRRQLRADPQHARREAHLRKLCARRRPDLAGASRTKTAANRKVLAQAGFGSVGNIEWTAAARSSRSPRP